MTSRLPTPPYSLCPPTLTVENPTATGTKLDDGKLRYDLVPADAMEDVVAVLTYGVKKYGARQWQGGIAWHRMFGAALRHLWAWWRGQDLDPESGLPHLAHASVNLLFLLWHRRHRADLDDRPTNEGFT